MFDMPMKLPAFNQDGLLPPGDYVLTLDELRQSVLVLGPGDDSLYPNWDVSWRRTLVDNLAVMVGQLWQVGVTAIFVDGSFAEDKEHPNDIDGYFECDWQRFIDGDIERELNLLEPDKTWTWKPSSRRAYRGYPKKQLPMWHKYRVELYPHLPGIPSPSGIKDQHGHDLEFPSAFRQSRRDGKPRGIVKIGGSP